MTSLRSLTQALRKVILEFSGPFLSSRALYSSPKVLREARQSRTIEGASLARIHQDRSFAERPSILVSYDTSTCLQHGAAWLEPLQIDF